ncbi:helix-hairpin-helix domain-containing protein [Chryseobacterium foetidum]|uniref:helix-hairpin-helix domain-containing protein n=1 Tax=Chryseobacterium foetidum TaxID=2951057 RepID=UPI0021C95382|nr:helix-hairpin-helix domain-containing protein [Chryseobacterium foetidum]
MVRKNYYKKIAILAMLLAVLSMYSKYAKSTDEKFPELRFTTETPKSRPLSEFDPNELSADQWQKLGFSEKQTATILKYKEIVGGRFISKEQLKKCYSISEEKFSEIESYILLPETNREGELTNFENRDFKKKELNIAGKFNPDHYSQSNWESMGFSERQAEAILKYKKFLGGSFVSKEKFRECFIISDENYLKLEPYLILPAKTPENFAKNRFKKDTIREKINYKPFDPNTLDKEGWQNLGFSEKQANVIVNYRDRNLKGSFKSLDDIKNCFVINEDKFNEMKPYIKLAQVKNASKSENFKETDFAKTDLNSITFKQLLEYGFDEKAAGSLVGFRKKLGGFVTKEQILDTYNIDKELTQKLVSSAPLDVSKVQKYSLTEAPEEWLKNHPYFKYSADKIIFYRMSNPDDRKIWKFIKVKPEYEARMRLYVK